MSDGIRVRVLPDAESVARETARVVVERLAASSSRTLGVATGSSPERVYELLAEGVATRRIRTAAWQAFALDEYVGLPGGHPQSYRAVLERQVRGPLGLAPGALHVPDPTGLEALRGAEREGAARAATERFEAALRDAGGVQLQLLGIGANGHIGFNEPGSSFDSRTRLAALAPATRRDNARFFASPGDVPTHCLTQGIGTILEARAIALVATGRRKAAAVAAALEGPVGEACPASALRRHGDVTVLLDPEAAAGLRVRA